MILYKKISLIIFSLILLMMQSNYVFSQEVPQLKVSLSSSLDSVSFRITSGQGVIADFSNRSVLFFIDAQVVYKIKMIENRKWKIIWDGGTEEINCGECSISPIDNDSLIIFQGSPFRGKFLLSDDGSGKILVVNQLPVEEYLCGVVPEELYTEHLEAMKAQAIVARTYAISRLGTHSDDGYDLCSTSHCQVYGGVASEKLLSNRAVFETRGIVITFNNKIASQTLYHSTCGGHTESSENVFLTEPVPYLTGVPCYIPLAGGRKKLFFCRKSSYFRWKVTWEKEELHKIVKDYLSNYYPAGEVGAIEEIFISERTSSGRVCKIEIDTDKGSFFIEGDNIRRLFKYKNSTGNYVNLKSTYFFLFLKDENYFASGGGWGHGTGLCQRGAEGMAFWGYDYEEIIKHYYKGVELTDNYGLDLSQ